MTPHFARRRAPGGTLIRYSGQELWRSFRCSARGRTSNRTARCKELSRFRNPSRADRANRLIRSPASASDFRHRPSAATNRLDRRILMQPVDGVLAQLRMAGLSVGQSRSLRAIYPVQRADQTSSLGSGAQDGHSGSRRYARTPVTVAAGSSRLTTNRDLVTERGGTSIAAPVSSSRQPWARASA